MATIENTTQGEDEAAFRGVSEGAKSHAIDGHGAAVGVRGVGNTWHGVAGLSNSTTGGHGVFGQNLAGGTGVAGASEGWHGVHGQSASATGGCGVHGEHSGEGPGVFGKSAAGVGVYGATDDDARAAVLGRGRIAGRFEGDVEVTGDIRLLGADLAEQFEVVGGMPPEPGSVMVIAGDNAVRVSDTPYDRRVVGVVSGAGDHRPALLLDHRPGAVGRAALAITGKVWVLADTEGGPIELGDLLTTSSTPGHAMRVAKPSQAVGTVVGKALSDLPTGRGMVRALVALQ